MIISKTHGGMKLSFGWIKRDTGEAEFVTRYLIAAAMAASKAYRDSELDDAAVYQAILAECEKRKKRASRFDTESNE